MQEYLVSAQDAEDLIQNHIFAVDREIVRCGDCKYYNLMWKGCIRNPCVEEWCEIDFCSYGERKEEAEWA